MLCDTTQTKSLSRVRNNSVLVTRVFHHRYVGKAGTHEGGLTNNERAMGVCQPVFEGSCTGIVVRCDVGFTERQLSIKTMVESEECLARFICTYAWIHCS